MPVKAVRLLVPVSSSDYVDVTSNSTACATAPQVVNNGGISLDDTVNAQVASISGIRDLPIFETFDSLFHSNGSICSGFEKPHGYLSRTSYGQQHSSP